MNIVINAVATATISGTFTACGSTVLTASTTASSPVYVWYKDNVAITDATSSTYSAIASGNYKVAITDQSTLCSTTSAATGVTINSAPDATITASSGTVTYGSTTTYTAVTGMSTYSWAITGDGTIASGAGTNQITVLATAATNYNLNLTVTNSSGCQNSSASVVYVSPVILTAATTIANKVYDGSATTGSVTLGTISGLIGSETLTITPTAANYANANVGTSKATTISYALANGSGGLASNYSMPNLVSSGNITQKALTAVTTVASKQYDGLATAGTVTLGTVSGLVGSESLTITPLASNYSNANVGTGKATTISYALANGSGLASNYSIANLSTTGDIRAIMLTIATPTLTTTKTYNGTTTAVVSAGALSGVLSAEAANVIVNAAATYNDASVATGKTITVVYTLSGSAITNYTKPVNYTTTAGEIDPVAPTGTASQSFCGN